MAQSTPVRERDPLLSPQNAAFAFIDYQPEQFAGVGSHTVDQIMPNLLLLGKAAKAWKVPVVLSTVAVKMGVNEGTVPELQEALGGLEEIDRTSMNSWEDADFRAAIEGTRRKKIVLAGLWTEVCVAFPALDLLREGYEVYVVADAIGGVTLDAHERAMQRMVQAGAKPVTALAVACELQRDWARPDADNLRKIMRWYFPHLRER
jgi:nicotinamidase-related amidase